MHILHRHVLAVGYINQSWALCILVGTLRVPLPTNPELIPVVVPIAVDSSLAGNGESIDVVGIYERREVFAGLSLDARLQDREVVYAVAALQFSALLNDEVSALLEEESSAEERTLRHHDGSTAVACCRVDNFLNGSGLHDSTVGTDPIIGNDISFTELRLVHLLCVGKPFVNRCAVRPEVSLSVGVNANEQQKENSFPQSWSPPQSPKGERKGYGFFYNLLFHIFFKLS